MFFCLTFGVHIKYTYLLKQVRRTHIDFDALHYMEQSLSNFLPLYSKKYKDNE